MGKADFFRRLGLLVVPQFFDARTCMELRTAVRHATATEATVYENDAEKLDADVRRTSRAHVASEAADLVRGRLAALQPDIERHFNVAVTAFREPQFLVYRVGDFFLAHRDASPDDPPNVRIRKVSVVIFLNGESAENSPDSFSGGSLVFYDLLDDPRLGQHRGLRLSAEEGLLVAFPAHLVHRVSPITAGERHTIVTWFT